MSAFWTDPTWPHIWAPKSLDYVIGQAALRMPATLLKDPVHRRHQKATHSQTGELIGYARWLLPNMDTISDNFWPEAKVQPVDAESETQYEKAFDSADWEYSHSMDELDEPMLRMKDHLMELKQYMRQCGRVVVGLFETDMKVQCLRF